MWVRAMHDLTRRYYDYVKSQPCLACRRPATKLQPSEVAHIRPVSRVLHGQFANRSHNGVPGYIAIPLCRACHNDQHKHSEEEWLDALPFKRAYVYAWVARNIAEFFLETDRHMPSQ